jgi:hypothetical protein
MANLEQIGVLNSLFKKHTPLSDVTNIVSMNEAFDPNKIEKAFNNSLADLHPDYLKYFELGYPADVALVFIDVCGFSTKFTDLTGEQISEYFDDYYNLIIPLIYQHDGEIDKIIGDGIIAVFGPPFSNLDIGDNIVKANKCAKAIIQKTANTRFESKIALHSGNINYFKNKTELYNEYTMIGKPLTELFRLETISEDNCINYYSDTDVASYYEEKRQPKESIEFSDRYIPWKLALKPIANLKGVDYTQLCYIKYKPLNK